MAAALGLLLILSLLAALLVWHVVVHRRRKPQVLIRIHEPASRWATRPTRMTAESLAIAQRVEGIVAGADLGVVKVVLFLGKPRTDLIVTVEDPEVASRRLHELLADLPVAIFAVGRPWDRRWVSRLWRHL